MVDFTQTTVRFCQAARFSWGYMGESKVQSCRAPSQNGCDLEDPVKTAHIRVDKYRLSHMISGTARLNLGIFHNIL
jgi:hypothetical protein